MDEAKPVFSDYAHMGTAADDIVFAVQLRNEEPQEELLRRILPMSQITPGKIVERVIRKTVEEESTCNKEGCLLRRQKLMELNSENDDLKEALKESRERVAFAKNKVLVLEKSLGIAEEKNDNLRQEIDNLQIKNLAIDEDIEKTEKQNEELQRKLYMLNEQIEEMKVKKREQEDLIEQLDPTSPSVNGKNKHVVFARKGTAAYNAKGGEIAREVSDLPEHESDDSDDDGV